MFNATPGVFSMPMMMPMAIQPTSFQQPKALEQSCSSSSGSNGRITDIEDRVNALDLRMRTIQRAVEIQTLILEEMKAEGNFPSRFKNQAATSAGNGGN